MICHDLPQTGTVGDRVTNITLKLVARLLKERRREMTDPKARRVLKFAIYALKTTRRRLRRAG